MYMTVVMQGCCVTVAALGNRLQQQQTRAKSGLTSQTSHTDMVDAQLYAVASQSHRQVRIVMRDLDD